MFNLKDGIMSQVPFLIRNSAILSMSVLVSSVILSAQEADSGSTDTIRIAKYMTSGYDHVSTGYSEIEKTDIIFSVSTVGHDLLNTIPSSNAGNLLQGRVSGVTVIGNGQPGQVSRVRIRGFSSFLDNNPLYVVDGVSTRDISFLNPMDVASVSILKDAGAASIYGSRASNGVIVISTIPRTRHKRRCP
jgi:TonB-dependent SusC/RagA subfamily outer membrane receptor